MNLSPARLRLIRSVGLLLMLAASVAGFMLLINLLAETASQGSDDLLAEIESDNVFISLPSSASLFALGRGSRRAYRCAGSHRFAPSNWRRSETGLPRPRWLPFGIAASIALIVGTAGLFLAFSDSSPLFQQQVDAGAIAAEQGAAGHQVYTEWIAPAWGRHSRRLFLHRYSHWFPQTAHVAACPGAVACGRSVLRILQFRRHCRLKPVRPYRHPQHAGRVCGRGRETSHRSNTAGR